jgi:hypothetical protein
MIFTQQDLHNMCTTKYMNKIYAYGTHMHESYTCVLLCIYHSSGRKYALIVFRSFQNLILRQVL